MAFTRLGTRRHTDASGEPRHAAPDGVESNARLTASTGVVLLVLLAAEGVTILSIRGLLSVHVFVGMLVVPPVVLKTTSTIYRFVRYYTGSPAYRKKGPPPAILRWIGPAVVILTAVVLVSGVALMLVDRGACHTLLQLHKISFILWFAVTAIHVLGHVVDTATLAPRDWFARTRRDVGGAGLRQWTIAASVVVGAGLGVLFVGRVGPWLASTAHVGN